MNLSLSAAMIAGPQRYRAQRVVNAMCAQTVAQSMEIIVVDLAPLSTPRLTAPPHANLVYLSRPDIRRFGQARAEAVKVARAPIVAFTEDHCYPSRTWAEKLIAAHQGEWAAVGYAFTNANPKTYISRSSMLARYGQFAHPARGGQARFISGNNVSYKRDIVLALGDRLEMLLDVDFNLHEELLRQQRTLFVEAQALGAHQNYTTLKEECLTGRPYCRLLAAHRANVGGWSTPRRLFYGVISPLSAPAIRLARLALSLRGRSPLWRTFVLGIPAIAFMYMSDGLGESAGYLFGAKEGETERDLMKYELETERDSS